MNAALYRPEFLLLGFVLIFSPLAFGSVEPWSLAVAETAALFGFALALRRRTRAGQLRLYAAPGTLPLLLFLGFIMVQALPLPPAFVRLLSPAAHARWAAALGGVGALPWLTLSLDPLATLREFCRFCACGAVYQLTVQLLARRERLRAVTVVLPIFAAALAFEAIVQSVVSPTRLLFVRAAPGRFPFGPFVNRNHYANLMAMLVPVVFGLFLGQRTGGGKHSFRRRLVDLLARPESGRRILLGFSALLAAASLVISLSRGATVATVAALLVFGAFLIAHQLGRRRTVIVALFFYALSVFVGWFGWDKVAERFSSLRMNPEIVDSVRAGLWRDTLHLASDFPILGAGVGSFARLYPSYRTVPGPFDVAHAHNDYLELIAGGGAVGLGLFAWFAGAALLCAARACSRRHDPAVRYLAFGTIAGCVAFLVHGASDFSLAIGANALYFFFLLGLAVSAAHAPGHQEESHTLLEERQLPPGVGHFAAACACVIALFLSADLAASRAWTLARVEIQRLGSSEATPPGVGVLVARAALLQPFDPVYPAALARISRQHGDDAAALALTVRATRLLPIDAVTLMQLGSLLSSRGQVSAARQVFEAAVAADPSAAAHLERFGAWLLARGDHPAGLEKLRTALTLEPGRGPGIFGMLVLSGFNDSRIAAFLPLNREVLLMFARYATTTGALTLAEQTYRRVLALDPRNAEAAAGVRALVKDR